MEATVRTRKNPVLFRMRFQLLFGFLFANRAIDYCFNGMSEFSPVVCMCADFLDASQKVVGSKKLGDVGTREGQSRWKGELEFDFLIFLKRARCKSIT